LQNAKQIYIPNDIFEYDNIKFQIINNKSGDDKGCIITKTLKIYTIKHSKEYISNFINKCVVIYTNEIYKNKINKILFFLHIEKSFKIYNFESNITFNNVFFKDKSILINLIDKLNTKDLNKIGIMLHGQPGCGKSSIIKCVSNYTKRHIISISLKNINSVEELFNIFHNDYIKNRYVNKSKRLYIIEDIDCDTDISHKRNEEDKKDKDKKILPQLTLSNILNCLDGVIELNDIIIIMTTNHIEKIDPALIRPGRINMILELTKLDKQSMIEMINYKYNKCINQKLIKHNVITPATLNNLMLVSETIEDLEIKLIKEYSDKSSL
jgi:SpoVK/Ycf46/Vps4 family AAA+-type ATPase